MLGWYCTEKGSNVDVTYKFIIEHFISKYNNVVFHGSSGGGFPSLFYASLFHKKAYITNSQLYLDTCYHAHYNRFVHELDTTNLTHSIHADDIINKHGLPSMMYIYVNERDSLQYKTQYIPFMNYVDNNGFHTNFKFVAFNGLDPIGKQTHHDIYTPTNITRDQIIDELFQYNNVP